MPRSGPCDVRGKQTSARGPRARLGTHVRRTMLRAWDVLRSATTATGSELRRSACIRDVVNIYIRAQQKGKEDTGIRTKRHSPASANGLVVNHSHMNALVDPSFTESIKPRMSLLTARGDHMEVRNAQQRGYRTRTLEPEVLGGPPLL